jgi:hypothetical protein
MTECSTEDPRQTMTAEDLALENKMASVHGPWIDKYGPFYPVSFPGKDDRRFRSYDAAMNAAERHNRKIIKGAERAKLLTVAP